MTDTTLQRIGVPAYFHPADNAGDWSLLASTRLGIVVANVADGPGMVREEQWADALRGVRAIGSEVVGYVDTGYLGITDLRTRLGSTSVDGWIEQILHDITEWYRLYGDRVTGIFFDQVAESNDGASVAPVYRRLRDHVLQLDPDGVTVLNLGMEAPPAFADVADVLVTFEGSCDDYLATGPTAGFEPLSWQPHPTQTIWHIVHHALSQAQAEEVVAVSRQRGASLLYVTDGCGANPYSSLPSEVVWATVRVGVGAGARSTLRGGQPTGGEAAEARTRPTPGIAGAHEILPATTLISNPSLVRNQHTIEASADFVVPSSCRRVFLASRRRDVPRWWTGSSPQIAADWLIENNRLYAYAGTGTDWTWMPSGQVIFEALGRRAKWCVDAERIGVSDDLDTDAEAAFHVSAPGYREYSAVATGCTAEG